MFSIEIRQGGDHVHSHALADVEDMFQAIANLFRRHMFAGGENAHHARAHLTSKLQLHVDILAPAGSQNGLVVMFPLLAAVVQQAAQVDADERERLVVQEEAGNAALVAS